MKSHHKTALALAAFAALFTAQIVGTACLHAEIKSLSDSVLPVSVRESASAADTRYVLAERFDDLAADGTVFVTSDGTLYAVDVRYPEEKGNQFLLRIDTRGTETPTDDEVLEIWRAPIAH